MKSAFAVILLALAAGCGDDHDDHDHDHGHEDEAVEAAPPVDPLPAHVRSERHGGLLTRTERFRIETVFASDGVEVYLEDPSGRPVDAAGARGRVAIEFQDRTRATIEAPLAPKAGGLAAEIDLSGADGAARAVVRLEGLPGEPAPIEFRRVVRLTRR